MFSKKSMRKETGTDSGRVGDSATSGKGPRFLRLLQRKGKAAAETSPTAGQSGEQAVDDGPQKSTTIDSLWDRAYDALKEDKSDRIALYEELLSRVLLKGWCSFPGPLPPLARTILDSRFR
jgi:hypothetical protein